MTARRYKNASIHRQKVQESIHLQTASSTCAQQRIISIMKLTQEFRRVFVVFFAWLEKLGIWFRDLMSVSWRLQGFLEARKAHNYERIIMLIEMISNGGLTKLLLLPDDAFCGLMHVLNHIQPGLNTTFGVGFRPH